MYTAPHKMFSRYHISDISVSLKLNIHGSYLSILFLSQICIFLSPLKHFLILLSSCSIAFFQIIISLPSALPGHYSMTAWCVVFCITKSYTPVLDWRATNLNSGITVVDNENRTARTIIQKKDPCRNHMVINIGQVKAYIMRE